MEFDRRRLLQLAGWSGLAWLTPLARALARQEEAAPSGAPARSLILLWLDGGPSQLETFDPQPDRPIASGTRAIKTALGGVQLAAGLERTAEMMESLSIVRSLVSSEGDHQRGTWLVKTGYRPNASLLYPSIGAILSHELSGAGVDLPRHISILSDHWAGRGGVLGDEYDAYMAGDPIHPLPDVTARAPDDRYQRRMDDLAVVEDAFARGRRALAERTLHRQAIAGARRFMSSEQLKAFDVSQEPAELRAAYGDTPFGRGCLAARRLTEAGVRCVEVSLGTWDSHIKNHEIHDRRKAELDPALAALVGDLKTRGTLAHTMVLCTGEFGRAPQMNRAGGRDHWTHGFSAVLAGGGLRGGQIIGATDPEGGKEPHDPRPVADLHATILTAFGLDPAKEYPTPIGRPIKLSEGRPMPELLGASV